MHKCGSETLPLPVELVQPQLDGPKLVGPSGRQHSGQAFLGELGSGDDDCGASFFRVLKNSFELVLCYFIAATWLLGARTSVCDTSDRVLALAKDTKRSEDV